MAWMLSLSAPFRQHKTEVQATPIHGLENGLKNPGCKWIPFAFSEP
jgi:hypothetical protein